MKRRRPVKRTVAVAATVTGIAAALVAGYAAAGATGLIDVASVATGRLTVVPRTFVSSDAMAGFGWPATSDTLIAELSFTTRVQVASWRPGAARLAVAAIQPGPSSTSLIVG